ncbi:MAG: GAF domain-containing protein, partial [Steroidobacteraceae bacterium]
MEQAQGDDADLQAAHKRLRREFDRVSRRNLHLEHELTRTDKVAQANEQALLKVFSDKERVAEENARLLKEAHEALTRQTAAADVLRVINRSPIDVGPVFEAIARHTGVLCDAHMVTTARFDGKLLHLLGFYGVNEGAEAAMRAVFPMRPGEGSINSRVLLAKLPIQIPDIELDPDYRLDGVAQVAGYRSLLAVPMLRDGEVVGVISVGRDSPGTYPEPVVSLLQNFAEQAVLAIENVRLFNETKEALEQQTATAEILKVITESP